MAGPIGSQTRSCGFAGQRRKKERRPFPSNTNTHWGSLTLGSTIRALPWHFAFSPLPTGSFLGIPPDNVVSAVVQDLVVVPVTRRLNKVLATVISGPHALFLFPPRWRPSNTMLDPLQLTIPNKDYRLRGLGFYDRKKRSSSLLKVIATVYPVPTLYFCSLPAGAPPIQCSIRCN
jgi:hypothetical protein